MNPNCPRCAASGAIKNGRFRRVEDAQSIQRYRCKACGKGFSSATFTPTYRQKRRRLNRLIEADIASCAAQRRIAIKLGCARNTVARKISFLAERARTKTETWLTSQAPFTNLQWDELITFEHTRLKPLSVAVMVCQQHRCILGFRVAQIPASGLIAQLSREKYGPRRNLSGYARRDLLKTLAPHIAPQATVTCDEHPRYREELKAALSDVKVIQHRSVRGSLTGQGELKRTGWDPLFTINHTLAMLRDNIKRLTRRTWCTTKRQSALENVIAIYVHFHNDKLVA